MTTLPCEIVQDLLPTYADELTSPVTNEAIQAHLGNCPACQESLERMKRKPLIQVESSRNVAQRIIEREKQQRKLRLFKALCLCLAVIGLIAAIWLPFPTRLTRTYHGVAVSADGEDPVSAFLEIQGTRYLLREDQYDCTLIVCSKEETQEFHYPGLDRVARDEFYFQSFTYGKALPNGYVTGSDFAPCYSDSDWNRICIEYVPYDDMPVTKVLLGTDSYTEEHLESYFAPIK